VNYDNSLVVTIIVTRCLWAPSSGDHLFTCGAIYRPPHFSVEGNASNFLLYSSQKDPKNFKCFFAIWTNIQ